MEGVRSLDTIYEFYRRPEFGSMGGPEMLRLLKAVADVLSAEDVYFGTSLTTLWLSKPGRPESGVKSGVGIWAHTTHYEFAYREGWQDGLFYRTRAHGISCAFEHARAALLEMLVRLNAAGLRPPLSGNHPPDKM
jgi:hypothetical protein